MKPRALAVAVAGLSVALLACAPAVEQTATGSDTEREAASADEGHEHPGDPAVPSRQAEMRRDEYSKPQQVYDFVGVEEGDHVADLLAGGGYNTYLLWERVGPTGRVYAQGGNEALSTRLSSGDMSGADNVVIVGGLSELPAGELDAVLAVRAYHLLPDVPGALAELYRALEPGGVVGIVETRLNQPRGHDMTTHRMGEETIKEDMAAAGFEYVGQSDILRRDDDDYGVYAPPSDVEGEAKPRYMTDRMLMKFRKPEAAG